VVVTFTLLSDGSVQDVVVSKPSMMAVLDEGAQAAILDSHHVVVGRRPLGSPANPDAFPMEVHRSSLHLKIHFSYNLPCGK